MNIIKIYVDLIKAYCERDTFLNYASIIEIGFLYIKGGRGWYTHILLKEKSIFIRLARDLPKYCQGEAEIPTARSALILWN